MYDLQIQAYLADLARVATFVIDREDSVRAYPEVGANDPHHPMTQHRNLPKMIEKVTKINTYLDRMDVRVENFGDATGRLELLDQLS
jgi:hypothetical protein